MHGAILPLPQYVFIAWRIVKHRGNFTFFPFTTCSVFHDYPESLVEFWSLYLMPGLNINKEVKQKHYFFISVIMSLWPFSFAEKSYYLTRGAPKPLYWLIYGTS